MPDELTDGVVRLRQWSVADADWYAATAATDELIQRFTTERADLTADEVRAAILALGDASDAAGFVICAVDGGERLGNIALAHADGVGSVSYWLAPYARGRGAATRALRLFSRWAFVRLGLVELTLWTHAANTASRGVALRAGYRHVPELDQVRRVRAQDWDTVAYRLPAERPGEWTGRPGSGAEACSKLP
jgi:ribosomal-protein-alanine N-acetyltransferase